MNNANVTKAKLTTPNPFMQVEETAPSSTFRSYSESPACSWHIRLSCKKRSASPMSSLPTSSCVSECGLGLHHLHRTARESRSFHEHHSRFQRHLACGEYLLPGRVLLHWLGWVPIGWAFHEAIISVRAAAGTDSIKSLFEKSSSKTRSFKKSKKVFKKS
ncbi:unnamed protein product [Symbiodinium natans]|uniref:Uncharacterized protein n=1 Tax=Symbiodinium natans TaxID=878477 RepID=A0A812UP11_9DINO|nr:unnamed protein product [Symbiodinium natans]